MPAGVIVWVLDVGQGSGNLIEVYDSSGTLASLVLCDLGSELNYDSAGVATANWVVARLQALSPHVLDALILSHSDSDHVNLLDVVLNNFDSPHKVSPTKPVLTINKIFYGGDRKKYKKRNTHYLTIAEQYLPVSGSLATSWANDTTGWDATTGKWNAFHQSGDVFFYLVVANTTKESIEIVTESTRSIRKLPDSYNINTKSLVVDVFRNNTEWILTGDATGLTMAYCNQVLASAGQLPGCFMLTMPHHASETTTFDLGGIDSDDFDRDELAIENVSTFANYMNADTISASADQVSRFRHPSLRVMSYFWSKLSSTVWYTDPDLGNNRHFYNAYAKKEAYTIDASGMAEDWPSRGGWFTVQTQANCFTTYYFNALQQRGVELPPNPGNRVTKLDASKLFVPPPLGAQWSFTQAGSTRSITRQTNRAVLAEAAAVAGPPLIWPQRAAYVELPALVEPTPLDAALAAARIPIASRLRLGAQPLRAAAPILRGLRAFR